MAFRTLAREAAGLTTSKNLKALVLNFKHSPPFLHQTLKISPTMPKNKSFTQSSQNPQN